MSQLDESIRKAELVALQLSMEAKFNENIRILKKSLPSLYKVFSKYKPHDKTVRIDSNGYPNIFDTNNIPIYPDDPAEYTRKQVQYYFENSTPNVIRFRKKEEIDTGYIHQEFMRELNSIEYEFRDKDEKENYCPTLFIFGVGFGYHIPDLIKGMDVRNLCIYEPDFDCFYWSLFTIDWIEVIEYFSKNGRNIEFVLGDKVDDVMRQITLFFDRIGIYNLVHISTFKHLRSKKVNEVSNIILQDAAKLAAAIGFYDDEKVGFAHTYENVGKGFPIGSKSLGQRGDLAKDTLVLVGNGPSLDRGKRFLESVKGKLPILSCGTTIGSLQRMGIKPDIHVEHERPEAIYHWLANGTSTDFRKGIRFVGMNTVYPKVFDLFDDPKIYVKPNDLGCQFLVENIVEIDGNSLALADCGNPTVTNFGASLAMLLGYRNIILIGVDLGMRDPDDHHSKYSIYASSEIIKENFRKKVTSQGYFEQAANFGGNVYTTTILDKSRMSFEDIIKRYGMRFLNTSDGVFIKGSVPVDIDDISLSSVDGSAIAELDVRLGKAFMRGVVDLEDKDSVMSRLSEFEIFIEGAIRVINRPVSCRGGVHKLLRDLHYFTKGFGENNTFLYMLIRGTVDYFQCMVASNIYFCKNNEVSSLYTRYIQVFEKFAFIIYEDMKSNIFKFDNFNNYDEFTK